MNRIGKGLGSLILLAVLLIGIPAALVFFAGNPLPSWDMLVSAFTMPDYTGSFLVGTVMPIAAWIAWATFAVGFLAELPGQLRGMPRPRIPGLGMQQKVMGGLLAAVIALFAPAAAFAAEVPTMPTVSMIASVSATVTADAGSVAEASTVQPGPQYVVTGSDTLARIAESTLGDRARASEISALNLGVRQAGGGALSSSGWLQEGWVLTLPADAKLAAAPAAQAEPETRTDISYEQRTIVSGDTLWEIADETLGDGARYPEIFEASKDIAQPGGRTITDPNWIYPGETVNIPVVTTVPVTPPADGAAGGGVGSDGINSGAVDQGASGEADAGAAGSGAEGAGSGAEGAGSGAEAGGAGGLGFTTEPSEAPAAAAPMQAPVEAAAPSAVDEDETGIEEYFNVATIGGIGGVLAAGLLTLLGWRRLKQRRARKPRQRIAMPDESLSSIELELRAVENPLGAEAVDTALRHLAVWAQETGSRLPALYALRLDESTIAVYLDEDADLPAPFTQYDPEDKLAWMVALTDLEPLDRVPSAPYPALVMLGHDDNNGHIFVDLERIGALNVVGVSSDARRGVLTAIAIELAANTWSEDVQVTLVGVGDRLPLALGSGRVRHIDDTDTLLRNLRGQAAAVESALEELGIDGLEQARTTGVDADAWAPEIIILGDNPSDQVRDEISELVTRIPRVGIAAVSAGHLTGSWNLALTDERRAELQIPGTNVAIPLTPQTIGPREYNEILALFDVATETPATGVALDDELELDEIPAAAAEDDDLVVDDAPAATVSTVDAAVTEPVEVSSTVDVPAVDEPLAEDAPTVETPAVVEEAAAVVAHADADTERPLAAIVPIHRGPYLQLLGGVEVRGARGEQPVNPNTAAQWRSMIRRGTELVSFLLTHENATAEQVHAIFWPGQPASGKKANYDRNGLLSKTRRWLGQNDEGEWYVPYITTGEYRLHDEVRSDWQDFVDLIGTDLSATSTDRLLAALDLVKGQPISGVPDKRYVFADRLRNEMIAMIGDVAHEAATRSLSSGKVRHARMASAIGRMVDPVNEVYWRDGLRAEHQAGDVAGVERLITQLEQSLASIDDDYEPEPETQALIAQLRRRHAIAS